jgi:uncharacterized RmlC-like cupin family protein
MQHTFWFLGTYINLLADHTTTAGRYDLLEGTFQPGVATPMHRHTTYSEHLYVLDGSLQVHTDATTITLKPGDNFHIPIGMAHAVVSGPHGGRGLIVASPSNFAKLIQTVGTPAESSQVPPTTPPDMEALARASREVGDEVVGPPPVAA